MTFNEVIANGLSALADEIAAANIMADGFAILKEPVGIRTRLKSAWEKLGEDAWDEWEGFRELGLECIELMDLAWDNGPGASSSMSLYSVALPSGRHLYTRGADDDDEPMILSVSDKNWTPRVDHKFLQHLFQNNLEPVGASVGGPPTKVSTCITSFRFLIDLFVAAFDSTESWYSLSDDPDFWNEKYENPKDPRQRELVKKSTVKMDEIHEFIFDRQFRKRSPQDMDAKLQIVGRWLAQALS
jgi:hypothetical protein